MRLLLVADDDNIGEPAAKSLTRAGYAVDRARDLCKVEKLFQNLPHIAGPSMPSDRLTFLFAVAASSALNVSTRAEGWWLVFIALPTVWSRIYWMSISPDMAGAAFVGSPAGLMAQRSARRFG
ncbi:hypothetical protein [Caballeronia sp. RCC_10]|uniref:hypothetical protein n=1 Tax=Caballeronia sp. RCC_10 TaxID=3239227 RepID=UPI003526AA3D